MTSKKKTNVANFNLVFSDKEGVEYPLLEFFDVIINAMGSGEEIKIYGTKYILLDVNVVSVDEKNHAITGYLVKNTTLEVLSELDESGNLIERDNRYPAAPFSYFSIYLNNHRMVYVQNQKGSPTLRNFAGVVYKALNTHIDRLNKASSDENKLIPKPELRVVGIPMRESVIETLRRAKSINTLKLKFYPLNGDIDYSGLLTGLTTDVRKKVGSKNGEIILRSPKNIEGIAEILEDAGGTVDPIFEVTYPDNTKTTIRDYQLSERLELNVRGDGMQEVLDDIVTKGKDLEAISYVSESNKQIYDNNKGKIIPFVKR